MTRRNTLRSVPLIGLTVLLITLGSGCNSGGGNNGSQTAGGGPPPAAPAADADAGGGEGKSEVFNIAIAMLPDPNSFAPDEMFVEAGSAIEWSNETGAPQTVTADPGSPLGGPNSDKDHPNGIPAGQKWTWTVPADAKGGTKWFYHSRLTGKSGNGKEKGTGMTGTLTVQ